ncbi:MAG: phytoene/squalene synthase family protein [Gammaproteobacteria bacterium]|jgi:phytoene synthase
MPRPCIEEDVDLAQDLATCRASLKGGSKSFHAASFLLPPAFRNSASALYAFCRLADDAIDREADSAAALARLRERLAAIYDGRPMAYPADRALAVVVRRCGLPRALPEALLEGFSWDAEGRRYPDLDGVLAYSARVAGVVGAMMAVLMGVREPRMLARASDLGVAMQLTNIVRDVGEDAAAGRIYLPLDWLRDAGIDPDAFLANPVPSSALAGVVRRLLAVADGLYRRADSGIARLPWRCRPGIYAARLLYDEIGREVGRRGFDPVSGRAVVAAARKLGLLARLPRSWVLSAGALGAEVLEQNGFLVAAVAAEPAPAAARRGVLARLAEAERKLVWVIDLFQDLERRGGGRALPVVSADERAV